MGQPVLRSDLSLAAVIVKGAKWATLIGGAGLVLHLVDLWSTSIDRQKMLMDILAGALLGGALVALALGIDALRDILFRHRAQRVFDANPDAAAVFALPTSGKRRIASFLRVPDTLFELEDLFADPDIELHQLRLLARGRHALEPLHLVHAEVNWAVDPRRISGGLLLVFSELQTAPLQQDRKPAMAQRLKVLRQKDGTFKVSDTYTGGSLAALSEALQRADATLETGMLIQVPHDPPACFVIADFQDSPDGTQYDLVRIASRACGGSLASLDAIIEGLPLPILKVMKNGGIALSNAAARQMLGLSEDGADKFVDVISGPGRSVTDWLADAFEGRGLYRSEVVRATRPGRELFLQVAFSRLEALDGDSALLAVLTDATELKTLEAQFVQSQKMQAIGQLAGGVAHDFNNLLTAISGHADLMLLRHDDHGDPNYADLMQITQNANRAAALVNQLLAFSRKQTLTPERLDLRDTMADLTHLLNRLVGETIQLELKHDSGLHPVRADKRQFEQVIMNLVVNARDAMPGGGRIAIRTRNFDLAVPLRRDRADVPAGSYVEVVVEDDGSGISPEKLPKIFEPFFTSKKVGEGTGLGLSTAYGIVKQTGGFIFAESTLGRGTCFTILLPAFAGTLDDEAGACAETPERPQVPMTSGSILLVEDEAPVRAFAARALKLGGHKVVEAATAEEALRLLEDPEMEIDVFVTDVVMPGLDGPTWVRKALEIRPDTRTVFVSGYAEDSVTESQAAISNAVFLPKPFSLRDLTETVQAQLASQGLEAGETVS